MLMVRNETSLILVFNPLLVALGFEKPSAIQQRAITPIVRGRDVIAQLVISCLLLFPSLHILVPVHFLYLPVGPNRVQVKQQPFQ